MSGPEVKIVSPLDELQLLMFAGTLTCLESKLVFLTIFYGGTFFILK
jgi:hypothetical protein